MRPSEAVVFRSVDPSTAVVVVWPDVLIVGAGSRPRSNFLAVALLSLLVVLMALLLVEAEKIEKNIEHNIYRSGIGALAKKVMIMHYH